MGRACVRFRGGARPPEVCGRWGHGCARRPLTAAAGSGVLAAGRGLGRGVLARPVGGRHPVGGGVPQTVKARPRLRRGPRGGAPAVAGRGPGPGPETAGRGPGRSPQRPHPLTPLPFDPPRVFSLRASQGRPGLPGLRCPGKGWLGADLKGQARGPLLDGAGPCRGLEERPSQTFLTARPCLSARNLPGPTQLVDVP